MDHYEDIVDVQKNQLEEGYYLDNFMRLINYVRERYDDLLKPEELSFIEVFSNLDSDSQKLYVRLISRKGPYFRSDKLDYPEISNITEAVLVLNDNDLLFINPREAPEFALQCFTKPELVDKLRHDDRFIYQPSFNAMQKDDLIAEILEYKEDWIWEMLEKEAELLFPAAYSIVQTLMLLFFGNSHQTLSDFILEDIGVLRYEPYQICDSDRFFTEREVVDGQLFLNAFRTELWIAVESLDYERVDQLGQLILSAQLHPRLERSKSKVFNSLGGFYERTGAADLALDFYQRSELPPSRERTVRLLEKLDNDEEAIGIVNSIMRDPLDFSEMEFAPMFREKLAKKLSLPIEKRKRRQFDNEELIIERQSELRIEEQVSNHLKSVGIECINLENELWKSLYGLYFWDEIFSPQPGVFFNPFQRGPADLFSSEFYRNRKKLIDKKLDALKKGSNIQSELIDRFVAKEHTANYLVNWKLVNQSIIQKVTTWVPVYDLVLIFERMSLNLRQMSSGFPDLLIWDGTYKLMEVKGPGDQLRPNQRQWLGFFQDNSIPSGVLKVKWGCLKRDGLF